MKPRLLDLFCGAGGCARGYMDAGFYVVGVDINMQPNYCGDQFVQADAMRVAADASLAIDLECFDAIHASPPCQAFTTARVIHGNDHPDLLTPTRELLEATGLPWVIENVPGAPMRPDFKLCGCMFPELKSANGSLRRERWFECSFDTTHLRQACYHHGPTISVFGHGGHVYHGVEDWREVMDIDWMTRDELAQAIPPAYTRFIAPYLLAEIESRSVAGVE